MTRQLDIDRKAKNPLLPFDSAELDRMGIRVLPAEFARLLDCSKQAVSGWIKAGKITIDADGRLDPRKAVAQLLRNTDPAKLRTRVLQPLMRDIDIQRQRIAELEKSLAGPLEEAEFNAAANSELLALIDRIRDQLLEEWPALRKLPPDLAIAAFCDWLDQAFNYGQHTAGSIAEFLEVDDSGAPAGKKKGKGDT